MSRVQDNFRRSGAFVAGILIGLSCVTPVFAATLESQLTPQNVILLVSLIVLAIGIALKVMERRRSLDTGPDEADLRWWLNP